MFRSAFRAVCFSLWSTTISAASIECLVSDRVELGLLTRWIWLFHLLLSVYRRSNRQTIVHRTRERIRVDSARVRQLFANFFFSRTIGERWRSSPKKSNIRRTIVRRPDCPFIISSTYNTITSVVISSSISDIAYSSIENCYVVTELWPSLVTDYVQLR